MNTSRWHQIAVLAFLLASLPASVLAAAPPGYTTTYTITVQEDSTALWQLEYRTPLAGDEDLRAFDNYTRDLPALYLPQIRELMQHSAAQASVATARPMAIGNVSGNAVVQTSPTGNYGVVIYSFTWSGFARPDGSITIGDAFAGGMYLAKDSTLIIRYPAKWTVTSAEPAPDQQRDGLVWYGLRSFGAGEPRIILEKPGFPVLTFTAALLLFFVVLAGFLLYRRRAGWHQIAVPEEATEETGAEEPPAAPLTEAEEAGLEERILHLLSNSGGEQYQAEIVRTLGLPKSTISSALNSLHGKGVILKVKKGRENLIRLVKERDTDSGR
jgi:hypothetical protein